MTRIGLITGVLALMLAGCATLSEDECLSGDWRGIGFVDGAEGYRPERVGEHREACARFGVTPNLSAWNAGYEEGLDRYCTPQNGVQIGASGGTYRGVCDGPRAARFMPAYQEGAAYWSVKSRLLDAEGDLSNALSRIDRIEDDLDEAERRTRDNDLPWDKRQAAFEDVKRLAEDLGEAKADRRDIEHDLFYLRNDEADARNRLSARFPFWGGW